MQLFDVSDTLQAISSILFSPFGLLVIAVVGGRIAIDYLLPPRRRAPRRRREPRKARSLSGDLLSIAVLVTLFWWLTPSGGQGPLDSPIKAAATCAMPLAWGAVIVTFIQSIKRGHRRSIEQQSLEDIRHLSADGFEDFVAGLFLARGYKAKIVGGQGDHGVDIEVTNPQGDRELVQCKRWNRKWLGEGVVREFFGSFVHDGDAVHGYIVTTSFFSEAARAWAAGKPIDLIDGKKLAEAVEAIGR